MALVRCACASAGVEDDVGRVLGVRRGSCGGRDEEEGLSGVCDSCRGRRQRRRGCWSLEASPACHLRLMRCTERHCGLIGHSPVQLSRPSRDRLHLRPPLPPVHCLRKRRSQQQPLEAQQRLPSRTDSLAPLIEQLRRDSAALKSLLLVHLPFPHVDAWSEM